MKFNIDQTWFDYLIIPVSILLGAFVVTRILRFFLNRFIRSRAVSMHLDVTKFNFLRNAINFIILIIATIFIFQTVPELKQYSVTLFASAGVFAAIVGFASQSAFSNIISGLFIVLFEPFRVGDHIVLSGDNRGEVEDITLRHTVIKNYENRRIVIPNSVISNDTIVNSSINDEKTCVHIPYGISYDSNIDLAIKIIQEEAMAHKYYIDNRTDEEKAEGGAAVRVRLLEFGDSSVNLRAYVWAESPVNGFVLRCDINKSIKERFDREGIEIPFPHRTIVYKDKNQHAL